MDSTLNTQSPTNRYCTSSKILSWTKQIMAKGQLVRWPWRSRLLPVLTFQYWRSSEVVPVLKFQSRRSSLVCACASKLPAFYVHCVPRRYTPIWPHPPSRLATALVTFDCWNSHNLQASRLAGCPAGVTDDLYNLPQLHGMYYIMIVHDVVIVHVAWYYYNVMLNGCFP